MGEHHHPRSSQECQPWMSPAFVGVLVIGAIFAALFTFLCYYGWLHTPGKPWQMMQ